MNKYCNNRLIGFALCVLPSIVMAADGNVKIDDETMFKDTGRVYHSSYLIEHRDVLAMISAACKSGVESNMKRCEQADDAQGRIRSNEENRILRLKMGVK